MSNDKQFFKFFKKYLWKLTIISKKNRIKIFLKIFIQKV